MKEFGCNLKIKIYTTVAQKPAEKAEIFVVIHLRIGNIEGTVIQPQVLLMTFYISNDLTL